jgi:uncharacterized protein (DUF433 family)
MSAEISERVNLTKYIEVRLFEDRPHIRGRRIPVDNHGYSAHGNKWDTAETAYQFTLSEAHVLAAMLYYEEHREEIDRQEIEEQVKFDEMKRLYGRD